MYRARVYKASELTQQPHEPGLRLSPESPRLTPPDERDEEDPSNWLAGLFQVASQL